MPTHLDRNEDGIYDFDELLQGKDPAAPDGARPVPATTLLIKNQLPDDESKNGITLKLQAATLPMPPDGNTSAPRCGIGPAGTVKATLTVSSVTSGESYASPLPRQNWALLGPDENMQRLPRPQHRRAASSAANDSLTGGHRRASLAR